MLDDKDIRYVKELFGSKLKDDVNLVLFIDSKSAYSEKAVQLLQEIEKIDERIKIEAVDSADEKEMRVEREIDRTPALLIAPEKGYQMYYFGVPSGYQFAALLDDIVDVSNGMSRLNNFTRERLRVIRIPVDIKVFVDPMEEICAGAVRIAHQFSMENKKIRSSMIDLSQFPEASAHSDMSLLPKVVINNTVSFNGPMPEAEFLEYVLSVRT